MDVYEAIYQRKSIRSFDPSRGVTGDQVTRLLEAAVQAPSAGNLQPWRFWVVRDQKVKEGLVEAALGQSFVGQAPVVIVVCADLSASARGYGQRGIHLYAIQDTAAAIENLLLAVQSESLGACWVGAFSEEMVSAVLDLPEYIRPVAIIPVGYPLRIGQKPEKKSIDGLTYYID